MAVLPGVDPFEIGLQGAPGGGLLVLAGDHRLCLFSNAQAAEQGVGGDQLWPQYFGQLAPGQAPGDFHLEQPVLGMHVAQGAVQVTLVLRLDMRHSALVITHADRGLEPGQGNLAIALRLLALHIQITTSGRRDGDGNGEKGETAFHRSSLGIFLTASRS